MHTTEMLCRNYFSSENYISCRGLSLITIKLMDFVQFCYVSMDQ